MLTYLMLFKAYLQLQMELVLDKRKDI
jgi:hypothetical protein